MKTIKELEDELEQLREETHEKYNKIHKLEQEIRARTSEDTEQYMFKYIKYVHRGYSNSDYATYMYITTAEHSYGDGWRIEGYGYRTYTNTDHNNKKKFENIFPGCSGLDLKDITEDGYYELTFITKEEFYNTRNKILQEIMNDTYE